MSRSSNVYARIEPELKEQSEIILSSLGIPMSNAIGMFLHQVVLHRGLPFEVKLPVRKPKTISELSDEDLRAELEKGFEDISAGRVRPASDVMKDLRKKYKI